MKKFLFIAIAVISSVITANAQLKVNSSGNVAIGALTTSLSPLSVKHQGNSNYSLTCGSTSSGLLCEINGDGTNAYYGGRFKFNSSVGNHYCIGLTGEANSSSLSSNVYATYGVIGRAGRSNYRNIGVLGSVESCTKGAGVFGSITGETGAIIASQGLFAGFFNGDTKVTGDLIVNGSIDGVLLGRSGLSPTLGEENEQHRALPFSSVSSQLSALYATQYQIKRVEDSAKSVEPVIDKDSFEDEEVFLYKSSIEKQVENKNHYALCAEQLEEVFPDLVYVMEDGTKSINYMEMIPLLVQSINELNARIVELEAGNSMSPAKASEYSSGINPTQKIVSRLYQNTPNPFKEQTVIRFQLADDVRDAAICIFDMSGKMLKKLPVSSRMESVSINGYELGEGMFLYSLLVNGQEIDTKRMILSK